MWLTNEAMIVFRLKPIFLATPLPPGQCWNPQDIVVSRDQPCKGVEVGEWTVTYRLRVPCSVLSRAEGNIVNANLYQPFCP